MFIRQLYQDQYDFMLHYLQQQGHSTPLDASYEVTVPVDDCDYRLRLQPGSKRKVAVLQAVRIQTQPGEPHFQLITDNLKLACLLELLLFEQKSAEKEQKTCHHEKG